MQQFRDVVLSALGNPIPAATVTVTISGGGTPTLYSDDGVTALGSNVLTTDANGEYKFYAANGRYTLTIAASGYAGTTRDEVLYDPAAPRTEADNTGAATDVASYYFQRRATYSGGTPGFVNAAVRAETWVESSPGSGTSTAAAFEWAVLGVLRNYSSAGENCAGYFQGNKYSTGNTWGLAVEAIDWSDEANPVSDLLGTEVALRATRTDNNNSRRVIDIVASRPLVSGVLTGASMAVSAGINFQHGGDSGASYTVGIDMTQGVFTQAALKINQDTPIAFNSSASRQLLHNGSSWVFKNSSGTTYWSLNDVGSLVVQGTQILGGRATGWGAPTGTATRTTFATSTVTLEQLAQRVKGLVDDLTTHGLIGT